MKKRILWIAADLAVAALVVLAVWIVNYKIPKEGIKSAAFPPMKAAWAASGGDTAPGLGSQPENQPEEQMGAQPEGQMEIRPVSLTATSVVTDPRDCLGVLIIYKF